MARIVSRIHNVHLILATAVCLVLLVAGALGWLGWKLLSQEQALLRQQARERAEQAADGLLAGFLRRVAETEAWLSQIESTLPAPLPSHLGEDAVVVRLSRTGVELPPPGRLLYYPALPPLPSVDPAVFREADSLEFQRSDFSAAASALTLIAGGKAAERDPRVRAEALLRLARVQSKRGHVSAALSTYAKLKTESLASQVGAPYGVVSRLASAQLLANSQQEAASRQEASELVEELESGRWRLGKESYAWYGSEARKLAGLPPERSTPDGLLAVAEAVESLWNEWQFFQRSGSRSFTKHVHSSGPVPVLALVNANPERLVSVIYSGNSIRRLGLDTALATENQDIRFALVDEHDQPILGALPEAAEVQAVRTLSAAELPWHLKLAISTGHQPAGLLAERRSYFIGALAAILLLICVACYAMARGVLREAAAGRLQSDFVSAVSHEFRSPLTTLRQLTELLSEGRIQDESRRRLYFDVLRKETSRLHQLVENLLDFGRMDAGRQQYRFEEIDFSELVRDGILEYQSESNGNGHRIELASGSRQLVVQADREAMRRVVRNLLENAVKYSPECPTVWVETGCEDGSAVLRVRDQGIGIPPEERPRIFEKFVRGEAAKRACIQGTGIGLAMVKEIVQVHRGVVDFVSDVGRGSTFMVRLPLNHGVPGSSQ